MITASNRSKTILLALLSSFIGINSISAFPISSSIASYSSSIKQRALFAKVMLKALWKGGIQKTDYTIIEKKLAEAYAIALSPNYSVESAVFDLQQALSNSPWNIKKFFLGASSSAYQVEGGLDETSAAARYYKNKAHLAIAGDAIDFFNRFANDIKQMKEELHINTFRVSIAWNRIQPVCGIFDQDALEFYREVITTLLAYDITPIVVFHHYDSPTWFEDLGGFENAENGIYFREFCLYMYSNLAQELGDCFISMCNAPEGPAFKGYFTGEGTPGEKDNLHKTHTVIANMYYELVETALQIKKQYAILKKDNLALKQPHIGTQINVLFFDPYEGKDCSFFKRIASTLGCEIASYVQSGGTANFLVSGEYRMFMPDWNFLRQAKNVNVYRQHKNAHKAFDWIGINIYSNNFLDGFKRICGNELIEKDEERYTDNPNYRNYPEGIYRAVQFITETITQPLGKLRNKNGKPLPIIITENGIATKDDAKRDRYFKRALCTITELIKDGYCVIGYTPWASHDNYEWPTEANPLGFASKCYGFFAVNFDKNSPDYLKRTLKKGSGYFSHFAQQLLT